MSPFTTRARGGNASSLRKRDRGNRQARTSRSQASASTRRASEIHMEEVQGLSRIKSERQGRELAQRSRYFCVPVGGGPGGSTWSARARGGRGRWAQDTHKSTTRSLEAQAGAGGEGQRRHGRVKSDGRPRIRTEAVWRAQREGGPGQTTSGARLRSRSSDSPLGLHQQRPRECSSS